MSKIGKFGFAAALIVAASGCHAGKPSPAKQRRNSPLDQVKVAIKVVDEQGHPIEGVIVTPTGLACSAWDGLWLPERYGKPKPSRTDANGVAVVACPKYAEEKLATTEMTLCLNHEAYPELRARDVIVSDRVVRLVLPRGAEVRLSGRLKSTDRALDRVYPLVDSYYRFDAKSLAHQPGSAGRLVGWIPAGHRYLRLVAFPKGGPICFSDVVSFDAEKGQTLDFNLPLEPGIRLEGNLDPSVPRPVRNGRVFASVPPGKGSRHLQRWTAWRHIDADGKFMFDGLPRDPKVEIIAVCQGFVSKSSPSKAKLAGRMSLPQVFSLKDNRAPVTLAMERSATCEVTVADPSGRPLEGAKVEFSPGVVWGVLAGGRGGGGIFALPAGTEDALLQRTSLDSGAAWPALIESTGYVRTTDGRGMAVIENLPGHDYQFQVSHDDYETPIRQQRDGDAVWRDRFVSVHLAPGQTARVAVKMQPKGKEFLEDSETVKQEQKPIYDPSADPKADLAAALARAKKEHRRVLVMFGGNWCVWCHRLHAVLLDDATIAPLLKSRYEMVMVDVASGADLLNRYDKEHREHGYPFLTVLDADGRVLVNQDTGVLEKKGKGYDLDKVKAFLTKWAP